MTKRMSNGKVTMEALFRDHIQWKGDYGYAMGARIVGNSRIYLHTGYAIPEQRDTVTSGDRSFVVLAVEQLHDAWVLHVEETTTDFFREL